MAGQRIVRAGAIEHDMVVGRGSWVAASWSISASASARPAIRRRSGSWRRRPSPSTKLRRFSIYYPETHSTKVQLQTTLNASCRASQAFANPPRIDTSNCKSAVFSPGSLRSENMAVTTVETHEGVFSNLRSDYSSNRFAKTRRRNFFRFGSVKSESIVLMQALQYARLLNVRSVAKHLRKPRCLQKPVSRNGSGMSPFVSSRWGQQVAAWPGKGKIHRLAAVSERSRPGAGVCRSNSGIPGAPVENGKLALERAGGPACSRRSARRPPDS